MRLIDGQCHCGNISYRFEWPGEGPQIPVRACSCQFCSKHGGVWTSHPNGRLEVKTSDPSNVTRYRFGQKTAVFHICATCGIVPLATCDIDGACYAVVNVNTFENVEPEAFDRTETDFEGEPEGERLARRRRNWTPAFFSDRSE